MSGIINIEEYNKKVEIIDSLKPKIANRFRVGYTIIAIGKNDKKEITDLVLMRGVRTVDYIKLNENYLRELAACVIKMSGTITQAELDAVVVE